MANEKQRRRRAKEKRHDYDLVYIDEEDNEVPVENESKPRKPPAKLGGKSSPKQQRSTSRVGRKAPQPPSWPRVLKRGMIFAPIFLATVLLLGGKSMTFLGAALQALLLIAVFIPFSYFMDKVVYRQYQKRLGKTG